ncbi:hypothetical protein DVH05_000719 [Phytophthora capsici]|nr:hypothetical protein DVH05_000719 [Phytophthora capsici]
MPGDTTSFRLSSDGNSSSFQNQPAREKNIARVNLRCGVYDEGSVFSVKIARDAKVSALQKVIFEKKRYKERFSFDASTLTLYLAQKKEGEEVKWLKDDRHVKDLLRGGVSTEYEEMRPSWRLNKEELLGPNFEPGEKDIHVLVKLPQQEMPPTKKQIVDDSKIQQMLKLVQGLDRTSDLAEGTLLETPSTFLGEKIEEGIVRPTGVLGCLHDSAREIGG